MIRSFPYNGRAHSPADSYMQAHVLAANQSDRGGPSGVLKVSMGLNFGADYIIPLLPPFLARHPNIRPDWQFTTRQVDLIAEGFDVAIGAA